MWSYYNLRQYWLFQPLLLSIWILWYFSAALWSMLSKRAVHEHTNSTIYTIYTIIISTNSCATNWY
jgi:hypothetical protein